MLKRLMKNNAGAAMTEYIIILALVAIAAITVVRTFGTRIRNMFDSATNELNAIEVAPAQSGTSAGGSSSGTGGNSGSGSSSGASNALQGAANAVSNLLN